jgi:hypothetical protein
LSPWFCGRRAEEFGSYEGNPVIREIEEEEG